LGDKIKNNEMGRTCGIYGKQERCIQGFCGGDLRERDHFEDLDVDGRTILKWILKKLHGGAWNGLICLKIGTGVGLLLTR
jgi:hypothetical protein